MSVVGPFEEVYTELRRLAARRLATEKPGQTLSATALVHEAWLRLARSSVEWRDKTHFMRTAATAMRRILVDRARAKLADKRGGNERFSELPDVARPTPSADVLAIDAALEKFAIVKPGHAKLVELRFFMGLSGEEAANVLAISPATADRMWRFARAWLQTEIEDGGGAAAR
jgi:RNA polymerase sigma factor (TIGR02999 family)